MYDPNLPPNIGSFNDPGNSDPDHEISYAVTVDTEIDAEFEEDQYEVARDYYEEVIKINTDEEVELIQITHWLDKSGQIVDTDEEILLSNM